MSAILSWKDFQAAQKQAAVAYISAALKLSNYSAHCAAALIAAPKATINSFLRRHPELLELVARCGPGRGRPQHFTGSEAPLNYAFCRVDRGFEAHLVKMPASAPYKLLCGKHAAPSSVSRVLSRKLKWDRARVCYACSRVFTASLLR